MPASGWTTFWDRPNHRVISLRGPFPGERHWSFVEYDESGSVPGKYLLWRLQEEVVILEVVLDDHDAPPSDLPGQYYDLLGSETIWPSETLPSFIWWYDALDPFVLEPGPSSAQTKRKWIVLNDSQYRILEVLTSRTLESDEATEERLSADDAEAALALRSLVEMRLVTETSTGYIADPDSDRFLPVELIYNALTSDVVFIVAEAPNDELASRQLDERVSTDHCAVWRIGKDGPLSFVQISDVWNLDDPDSDRRADARLLRHFNQYVLTLVEPGGGGPSLRLKSVLDPWPLHLAFAAPVVRRRARPAPRRRG